MPEFKEEFNSEELRKKALLMAARLIALADSRFHKFFFWIAMITCFGFIGCARDDYHSRSFVAGESTLFIALDLPNELDTFQTWVDYSDVACAHQAKYRFSDSRFQLIKESGFMSSEYPDSSYRVTFSHVHPFTECVDEFPVDTIFDNLKSLELSAQAMREEFVGYDEGVIEANGINLHFVKFRTVLVPAQKYPSTILRAFFVVKKAVYRVEYECARSNCDGFFERMENSLKSIKVKEVVTSDL
jgi:hypothetical protein